MDIHVPTKIQKQSYESGALKEGVNRLVEEISALKDANDTKSNMLVKVNQKELEDLRKENIYLKKII